MAMGEIGRYQQALSQAARFRARMQAIAGQTVPITQPNFQLSGRYGSPVPTTEALGAGTPGAMPAVPESLGLPPRPAAMPNIARPLATPFTPLGQPEVAASDMAGLRGFATMPNIPPPLATPGGIGAGSMGHLYTHGPPGAPATGPMLGPEPVSGLPLHGPEAPAFNTVADQGLGTFGPPVPPTWWQTLKGEGPGGPGLLGRLGAPAAVEGEGNLARIGGVLKGSGGKLNLVKGLGLGIGGEVAGGGVKALLGADQPFEEGNIGHIGHNLKVAAGDVLGNGLKGAGWGASFGVPGAAVGAIAGMGATAINDIFGQGKASADVPVAAAPPAKPPSTAGDLAGLMTRVALPPELHQKVLDGYRDQLEYYRSLGSAPDPTDPAGKKMTTDPAMMERAAFTQAVQMIPVLKQQSAEESASRAASDRQHSDYIRRATLLQGALAQIAPQLLTPSNYLVPGEYNQASGSLQAIPAMLAMGEAADQQKQYASALQQASVARTMAALPQSQADNYNGLLQSAKVHDQFYQDYPQYAPKAQQSADTSATDAINASK